MNYKTYDDLNKAKEKINYLYQMKYKTIGDEEVVDNNEAIDRDVESKFNIIIQNLQTISDNIFNMTTLTKKSNELVPQPFFRTLNSYTAFVRLLTDNTNLIKNVNEIYLTIKENIGYVEPQSIVKIQNTIFGLYENSTILRDNTYKNGEFNVKINSANNVEEKKELQDRFKELSNALNIIMNIDEYIKTSYNYKTVNAKINRQFVNDKKQEVVNLDIQDEF